MKKYFGRCILMPPTAANHNEGSHDFRCAILDAPAMTATRYGLIAGMGAFPCSPSKARAA